MKAPHWPDGCEHGLDAYITTFNLNGKMFDLYVFAQPSRDEICIRYGPEEWKYISPGEPFELARRLQEPIVDEYGKPTTWEAALPEYVEAIKLLRLYRYL